MCFPFFNALPARYFPCPFSTTIGTGQGQGIFHCVFDQGHRDIAFVFVQVKDEFVVYL